MVTRSESTYKWQFVARFRRNAFGWKSDAPMLRIKEALAEIKQVARKDQTLAAEGAILFLQKLVPAIEQVDSSSGAIGSTVYRAIEVLVPIISKAQVEHTQRQKWLEQLWQAISDDGISYIESLSNHWGELCVEPNIAQQWIDDLLPFVERAWQPNVSGYGYFNGTSACLSCMLAVGQYEQLLTLLDKAPHKHWHDRQWGVKALVALGRKAEAIRYAEACRGLNVLGSVISETCESLLLSSGLADEAYKRYALAANQSTTHLATFRAIVKKYPHKAKQEILQDLIVSTPGAEGKWFAAAKDAKLYEAAIALVQHSPTDPRTLTRAARDYAESQPEFALSAGFAALRWMAQGYGYEITGLEVSEAYDAVTKASIVLGKSTEEIQSSVRAILDGPHPMQRLMGKALQV